MPIHSNFDTKGWYFQWGNRTKYYFSARSEKEIKLAYKKALKQAQAAYANGYRGK